MNPLTVKIGAAGCPVCLAAARRVNEKLARAGGAVPGRPAAPFGRKLPPGGASGSGAAVGAAQLVAFPDAVTLCSDPSSWDTNIRGMWTAFQTNPSGFAQSGLAPILAQALSSMGCASAAGAVESLIAAFA